jgi:RsiW-degrading membrane proteinase PrsW (M82 family)
VKSISAGLAAAGVVLVVNKLLIRGSRGARVIVLIPFVEETVKAVVSILCGANVLVTHTTFGISEAAYDMSSTSETGIYAAVVSIVGHALCGYAYLCIERLFFSSFAGFLAALMLHLSWNVAVVHNSNRRNKV